MTPLKSRTCSPYPPPAEKTEQGVCVGGGEGGTVTRRLSLKLSYTVIRIGVH